MPDLQSDLAVRAGNGPLLPAVNIGLGYRICEYLQQAVSGPSIPSRIETICFLASVSLLTFISASTALLRVQVKRSIDQLLG